MACPEICHCTAQMLSPLATQVNVLPWEQDCLVTVFLSDMEQLEKDLRTRKLDRHLGTNDRHGKPHVAFEYLTRHEARLKSLILELDDVQTGKGLVKVNLSPSTSRRSSRSRSNFSSTIDEFNSALDDLADLAHDIHEKVNARLMNTDAEERWVKRMQRALDLRVMAFPSGPEGLAASASAIAAAQRFTTIAALGLTVGDRIEVQVQDEPAIWWPAVIGGPVAGAGIHGVRLVYDAFEAQGYDEETLSRAAFEAPTVGGKLWDAEEDACWPWRRVTATDTAMEVEIAGAEADAALASSAPTDPVRRAEFDALLLLLEWMDSRFLGSSSNPDPMPGILELWEQRTLLASRLQASALKPPYHKKWVGASGTVIQKDFALQVKFNEGCGDFLHLYKHMACKTANEAVVEGMGSFWDDCAAPKCHLKFETSVKEAVICYNGPPPHRPEATSLLHTSLNTYFEGGPEKWNFFHEDPRHRGIVWASGSKVIDRLLKVKPRLPSECYEC